MIITKYKIEVNEEMMKEQNLSLLLVSGMLGVPFSATTREPVRWKLPAELTEEDCDLIEDYFLNLKNKTNA